MEGIHNTIAAEYAAQETEVTRSIMLDYMTIVIVVSLPDRVAKNGLGTRLMIEPRNRL